MFKKYKFDIKKHGFPFCEIHMNVKSVDKLKDVADRFPEGEGFEIEMLAVKSEKRILESSEDGIRLLASEFIYESASTES